MNTLLPEDQKIVLQLISGLINHYEQLFGGENWQTLTGYSLGEYSELHARLTERFYLDDCFDWQMLHLMMLNYLGYPFDNRGFIASEYGVTQETIESVFDRVKAIYKTYLPSVESLEAIARQPLDPELLASYKQLREKRGEHALTEDELRQLQEAHNFLEKQHLERLKAAHELCNHLGMGARAVWARYGIERHWD
jgi:hypothetical protein